MKISVITICLNSESTILYTLNSVISQKYSNVEHIIVDGGSTDKTLTYLKEYNHKNKKIIIAKGKSLYESLNIGIKFARGKIISILHSDDIYNNNDVLSKISKIVKKSKNDIFFGNVVYFKNKNFQKVIRHYPSSNFQRENLFIGNMPPHTGSFYRKAIFKKHGYYNKSYKIAGDFDHLLRIIGIKKIKFQLINFTITRMKTGGLSGKNLNSFIQINKEILRSFKENKIKSNLLKILLRVPSKLKQYIFLNQEKLNSEFFIKESKYYKSKLFETLNVVQNIRKVNFKKNFVLSALNLAFLGSLAKNEINLHSNLINWPDGIFSKIYEKKINKIPGRKLLNDLIIPKSIKRLIVLGNLSKNSKKYLEKKYKKKIVHQKLPFGSSKEICKKINLKINNSDVVFLTLPTPKQEQIAHYLMKINKYYKIICIGGSIGIVSGDEKPVPDYLINFEFIWRLRYETKRRLTRLISTFYRYVYDILIIRRLKEIRINLIN